MTKKNLISGTLSRQFAVAVLVSALGFPVWAQSSSDSQSAPASATQSSSQPSTYVPPAKEGFWGRMNPFARKKWVSRQLTPINDQLNELDQVNAKNAREISDVDARAQAGIHRAQSIADTANQTATSASSTAQQANSTAEQASNNVQRLDTTVSGLDQFKPVTSIDVNFRGESPVLSPDARQQLDSLASSVAGREGYILQIAAHSPAAGAYGIQSSQRMAEAVERYLVTQHQIPIYRMHAVALGNVQGSEDNSGRVRHSSVHVELMENSLAAQGAASPQGTASLNGADRQ
jgi:outer membrane protein OmpA-like peptidoglycan-associated protein